jgi:hypothetical protein
VRRSAQATRSRDKCSDIRSVCRNRGEYKRCCEKAEKRQSGALSAKGASKHLKANSEIIGEAAKKEDKQFFIDLGKCLSGEINAEICDPLEHDIAFVVLGNPLITAKNAVRELKERGGWTLSEEHFRVIKKRLRLAGFIRLLAS